MNDLVTQSQDNGLAISTEMASLIQSSVAPNTIAAYRRATQKLEAWLDGQILTDGLLATYITELHHQGKSPATISPGRCRDQVDGKQIPHRCRR